MKIVGYHGTCTKHRKSIEKNGLDPGRVNFRKDHWLGQGVYFFDDFDKALWWARDISNKEWNKGSAALIYRAEIEAAENEILNLDDNAQVDEFYSFILDHIENIEKSDEGKIPIFRPEQMRAVYFDYYKTIKNIFVVIRTFRKDVVKYGSYRNREQVKKQRQLSNILGICYNEKQICVSVKECIKDTVEVYNGEEEVI